jgi:hypothetical protein
MRLFKTHTASFDKKNNKDLYQEHQSNVKSGRSAMQDISKTIDSVVTAHRGKHTKGVKKPVDSLIDVSKGWNTAKIVNSIVTELAEISHSHFGIRQKVNDSVQRGMRIREDRASKAFGDLEGDPKARQATIDLFTQYGGYTEDKAASVVSWIAGIQARRDLKESEPDTKEDKSHGDTLDANTEGSVGRSPLESAAEGTF